MEFHTDKRYTMSNSESARVEKTNGKYLVVTSHTLISRDGFSGMVKERESKILDTVEEVREHLFENADETHKSQFTE
jgi:hypothetical protein